MINHSYWWQKHLNLLEIIWKYQCVRIHYSYHSAQWILEASSSHLPFRVCWMSAGSFPQCLIVSGFPCFLQQFQVEISHSTSKPSTL